MPQKPSCCPLGSTDGSVFKKNLQSTGQPEGKSDTVAEKALDEGSEEVFPTSVSKTSLISLAIVSSDKMELPLTFSTC